MIKRSELVLLTTIVTLGLTIGAGAYAQREDGILSLDSDGDGRVSRDEFRLPEKRRGAGMLTRADTDGDGIVTRAEVEAATSEQSDQRRDRMLQGFDGMDADGNGVVTPEELTGAAFSRVDGDGDGFVTQAEAESMRDARAARKKENKGKGKGKDRDSEA